MQVYGLLGQTEEGIYGLKRILCISSRATKRQRHYLVKLGSSHFIIKAAFRIANTTHAFML